MSLLFDEGIGGLGRGASGLGSRADTRTGVPFRTGTNWLQGWREAVGQWLPGPGMDLLARGLRAGPGRGQTLLSQGRGWIFLHLHLLRFGVGGWKPPGSGQRGACPF